MKVGQVVRVHRETHIPSQPLAGLKALLLRGLLFERGRHLVAEQAEGARDRLDRQALAGVELGDQAGKVQLLA